MEFYHILQDTSDALLMAWNEMLMGSLAVRRTVFELIPNILATAWTEKIIEKDSLLL
jgi:hypothetical protein